MFCILREMLDRRFIGIKHNVYILFVMECEKILHSKNSRKCVLCQLPEVMFLKISWSPRPGSYEKLGFKGTMVAVDTHLNLSCP
jgi:hypothetical protein